MVYINLDISSDVVGDVVGDMVGDMIRLGARTGTDQIDIWSLEWCVTEL